MIKLLNSKKNIVLLFVLLILVFYIKIYKFDRYFITSENNKNVVTYFKDGDTVYIMPYEYWGLQKPVSNYIKFDRSRYSEEMNILTFYNTDKYPFVFEYDNGDLIENKLNKNYYYFTHNNVYKNLYLHEIRFANKSKKIKITAAYIKEHNPIWNLIYKMF